jgi:hypothetical protein
MANTIQIKRSTSTAAPTSLSAGELAYSSNSSKFYIGHPDGTTGNVVIGGALYVNMLDHTAGTLTASSAILVDANSKVDQLLVDNIRIGTVANRIDTSSGDLTIHAASGNILLSTENTSLKIKDNSNVALVFKQGTDAYITLDTTNGAERVTFGKQIKVGSAYTLPTADGSNGQALVTNGSGVVSFATVASNLTIGADSGSNDTVTLTTDTLTFTGGEGVDTTVSNNTITIAGEDATTSNKGVASFNTSHFTVSSGAVSAQNFTIGSTALTIGGSSTTLAGIQQLDVDNVRVDANTISTTDSNGNLVLSPNGTGTVTVPSGYKSRAGFGDNSLVSKEYVDAVKQSLDIKDSVRVATTGNITLSGTQQIDGVTLSVGDRVLVKSQTSGSQNGIYAVASSTWARSTDADVAADITSGMFVFVTQGTTNADSGWVLTTDGTITVGSTSLVFTQFSGAGQITAGDALVKSGNTLNVNDDNITLEVNSDTVRIKGITATAVGDLLVGQASNAGFTSLAKPSGNATAYDYILSMNTSGAARWANTLDGGTF